MEIWKPVPNYQGHYEISSHGRVRSINKTVSSGIRHNTQVVRKGKVLKPNVKRNGYLTVDLSKDNTVKTMTIHRIEAVTFLENPEDKPQVNHRDGNKSNNMISNLEWFTCSENQKHRYEVLGHVGRRKQVLCVETGEKHSSSKYAALWLNQIKFQHSKQTTAMARKIRQCCVGEKTKAYEYHWKYVV